MQTSGAVILLSRHINPAGHVVQLSCPKLDWYVPTGHDSSCVVPASQKNPRGQMYPVTLSVGFGVELPSRQTYLQRKKEVLQILHWYVNSLLVTGNYNREL
jgi:hypothetical protein